MSLRPYKFVVQAVVQQLDEDGNVAGEASVEPVTVFGCDALAKWADEFTEKLVDAAQQTSA